MAAIHGCIGRLASSSHGAGGRCVRKHMSPPATTPCAKSARLLRPASFAGAVPVDDAALGEVVGGHLEIDPVAGEYLDAVAPEASGDVCQDRLAVLEFDGEGRTRKDLFDGAEQLEGGFLGRFLGRRAGTAAAAVGLETAAGYDCTAF